MAVNNPFNIHDYTGYQGPAPLPTMPTPREYTPIATQMEAAGVPVGGAPQQSQGPGVLAQLLSAREKQAGRKLTPEELDGVGNEVRTTHLPQFAAQGKLQEWQYEQMQSGFDQQFEAFKQFYFSQPGAQVQAGEDSERGLGNTLKEVGGSVAAGFTDLVGGAFNLADTVARYGSAVVTDAIQTAQQENKTIGEFMTRPVADMLREHNPDDTFLGTIGQGANDVAEGIREATYLPQTREAMQRMGEAIERGSTKDAVKELFNGPGPLLTLVGEVGGGFGAAKLATKLPKVAAFMQRLNASSPAMARATAAAMTGTGYAGNAVNDFEQRVDSMPLQDLLSSEANKAYYDSAISIGIDQAEAERRLRDRVFAYGADDVLLTSLIANVALPAVPGLGGVEQKLLSRVVSQAPGQARRGLARRVGAGAVSEAGQEALAGGVEQAGQNAGLGADTSQGVVPAMAVGGIVGAVAGGTLGALPDAPRAAPARATPGAQPSSATPTPGAALAAPTPVQAATAPVAAATDNKDFPRIQTSFQENVRANKRLKDAFRKSTIGEASELIGMAEALAQENVGEAWDTLSRPQQIELVKFLAREANNARKKTKGDFEDIESALTAYGVVATPEAATVETVPVQTPTTPAEEVEPDVPEPEPPQPAQAVVSAPTSVEAPAVPVETPPAPVQAPAPVVQTTPAQRKAVDDQAYFNAVANYNQPADATTEQFRDRPTYAALVEGIRAGTITDMGSFRTALRQAEETIKNAPPKKEWVASGEARVTNVGELRNTKRTKKSIVAAKKHAQDAFAALTSMGMEPAEVDKLNLKGAMDAYTRLTAQGLRPTTAVAATLPATEPAPIPKPKVNKLKTKPKQSAQPTGAVKIDNTQPEPPPANQAHPAVRELRNKLGRRITVDQQLEVQKRFDSVARTGKGGPALRVLVANLTGSEAKAVEIDDIAGDVFSNQTVAANEVAQEAPVVETKPKGILKGKRAQNVRPWISELRAPGNTARISETNQKSLEALYSRLLVRGGSTQALYRAVEAVTGNADAAQQAVDRYEIEFFGLTDTDTGLPRVQELGKLASVPIPAKLATALNKVVTEIGTPDAVEAALAIGRKRSNKKGDALKPIRLPELRQAVAKEIAAMEAERAKLSVANRPKTKAPAQTVIVSGAESSSASREIIPPTAEELAAHTDPTVVQAVVMDALGDADVANSTIEDIVDAVVQARLENPADLRTLVRDLQADKVLTHKQVLALQRISRPVNQIPESQRVHEAAPEGPTTDALVEEMVENPRTRVILDSVLESDSDTKAEDLLLLVSQQNGVRPEQKWLARKLAPLMTKYGVTLGAAPTSVNTTWAGAYQRVINNIWIRQARPTTVLHEAVHGATSNILAAGEKANAPNDIKQLVSDVSELRSAAGKHYRAVGVDLDLETQEMMDNAQGPLSNNQEFLAYALTDRDFIDFLKSAPATGRTQLRNIWQAFKDAISSFFGANPAQRTLLDEVIEVSGAVIDFGADNSDFVLLANRNTARGTDAAIRSPEDSEHIEDLEDNLVAQEVQKLDKDFTLTQSFMLRAVDRTIGLERAQQAIRKLGFDIPFELDIVRAKILFDGERNEYAAQDSAYVMQPILNWLDANLTRFGTRAEALENISRFFRNKTQLNRYHWMWLERVRLSAGRDVMRQMILDDIRESTSQEEALRHRNRLEALVAQYRTQSEEEYGTKFNPHYPEFRKGLDKVSREFGINETSMADLNALMQRARDQIRFRMEQAGKVDPNDPWIWAYNDQWYVPLKGERDLKGEKDLLGMDYGDVDESVSSRILSTQLKVAQGTREPVTNTVERLLSDLMVAGNRAAEYNFVDTVYAFTKRFQKQLGATIRVYNGRPRDGFTQVGGPRAKDVDPEKQYRQIPRGKASYIFSDGDTHYAVELPEGHLLRGILGVYAEPNLWEGAKIFNNIVGKGTNLLSKSYTIWKPWWTAAIALVRDVTYVPIMTGATLERNPLRALGVMGQYYVNLTRNAFSPSNAATAYHMVVTQDLESIDKHAKDNPGTFVDWMRRYQRAGGGTNVRDIYNPTDIRQSITGAYDKKTGMWEYVIPAAQAVSDAARPLRAGVRAVDGWLTGWANVMENVSRVAAFRTLVEQQGMPEREAAAITKGILNYDQRGVWTSFINSYVVFFKVGMTSADAMRKVFIKPTGEWDTAKLAMWTGFLGSIGFMGMAMTRLLAGEDDDEVNRLDKIDINTLTQNFVVYVDGKPHKLPIGLGLPQLLLGPGIIAESLANGNISFSEAGRAMYELYARNAPVRPGGLPEGWTFDDFINAQIQVIYPTVIAPIAQTSQNRNTFGREIHTVYEDEKQYRSDQGKPNTNPLWTDVATFMRETVGVDYYPEVYKHWAQSYVSHIPIDNWSKVVAAAQEEGMDASGVVRLGADIEVRDPEFYYVRQLHNTMDRLMPAVRDYNNMRNKYESDGMSQDAAKAAAGRWLAADPDATRQYRAYKALEKAQREYYNERRPLLRDRTLSPTRRELKMKQLDSRLREATDKAKQALEAE